MENPDTKDPSLNSFQGDLRFVKRSHPGDPFRDIRILQRYEWSYTEHRFDWFDVPLVEGLG